MLIAVGLLLPIMNYQLEIENKNNQTNLYSLTIVA